MKISARQYGMLVSQIRSGWIGLVWRQNELVGFELPGLDATEIESRLRRRFPFASYQTSPNWIIQLTQMIERHLAGIDQDFSKIKLAWDGVSDFRRRVYQIVRQIPTGEVRSYGEVARLAGSAGAARAVGGAMRMNPFPLFVPCHRVVGAGRGLGGFTATGGIDTKIQLLKNEGIALDGC